MNMEASIEAFVAKWNGVIPIFPGVPSDSCMANMHLFARDVLGIIDVTALAQPFAYMLASNYPNYNGANYFTFVPNTPDYVPPAGSFAVWGQDATNDIPQGHVGIVLPGATVSAFQSFDADFPYGSPSHVQNHNYTDVVGFLVPNSTVPNYSTLFPPTPPVQSASGGQPSAVAVAFGNTVNKSKNFDTVTAFLGMSQQNAVQLTAGQIIVNQIKALQDTVSANNTTIAGLKALVTKLSATPAPQVPTPAATQTSPNAVSASVTPASGPTLQNGTPAVSGATIASPATIVKPAFKVMTQSGQPGAKELLGSFKGLLKTLFW